jgi:plasmid stability protein
MRQMTIRKIDDDVYRRIRDLARISHRSMEAEVRAILRQAAYPDRAEIARRAAAMRAHLAGHYTGDSTADIREDRDR